MSYSFSVRAATKDDAKTKVAAEFDEVVKWQLIHARDKDAAIANANACIDLLADDETRDVYVSCNGYVTWTDQAGAGAEKLCGASISATACHLDRPAAS